MRKHVLLVVTSHLHTCCLSLCPGGVQSIVMSVSVCLSVCLSACLQNSKTTQLNYTNLYACCLWRWLSPPLTASGRCDMLHTVLRMTSCFPTTCFMTVCLEGFGRWRCQLDVVRQLQCLVEFVRMLRHRGGGSDEVWYV